MHHVRADHHVRQVRKPVQQRDEGGDLVTLAVHVHLRERDAIVGEHHTQAMPGRLLTISGAALGLAVHTHRDKFAATGTVTATTGTVTGGGLRVVQIRQLRGSIAGVGRVHLSGIHPLQYPAHGVGVRRLILPGPPALTCTDISEDLLGCRSDPVSDRGEARRTGHHRGLHQRQDHHQRMTPPPADPADR